VERRRSAIRTAVVWDALEAVLSAPTPPRPLRVVDLGGGTGGLAVRIGQLGHQVLVVDPSPDALASLERRVAEAGITTVRGVLGDADSLLEVVDPGTTDLVLCHELLEVLDKPARALEAAAAALDTDGIMSVVATQRAGGVFGRVLAGHLTEALALLDDPDGRGGPSDALRRRFTEAELRELVGEAGFTVTDVRGVRIFADHLSSAVVDSDPSAAETLQALESAAATRPEFMAVATQLHLLASKA
jgi:S-adenosylmethionine-dependent methyltransferase